MKSKIAVLAVEQGFENIQQFALKAGLPWPAAKRIWTGDLANRSLKTLFKAATALGCTIEDLFTVTE